MANYTVYYTVPFYPYKSLIYKGFSEARFSVNPKKSVPFMLAPQPGLEPGTYGLTENLVAEKPI